MKYPLSRFQLFVRETTCFLFGHKWKHAPRRLSKYYGVRTEEIPYEYRKLTGNPYFENISWWTGKCVRCRHKERDNMPWNVWHVTLRNSIKNAWRAGKCSVEYLYQDDYAKRTSLSRRILVTVPIVFSSAWFQLIAGSDRLPWSWWTWTTDIEYRCYEYLDQK